jgi:hypothetical protein
MRQFKNRSEVVGFRHLGYREVRHVKTVTKLPLFERLLSLFA